MIRAHVAGGARRAAAFLATIVLLGCYTMTPAGEEPPSPGQEIVVEFTAAGAQQLGGLLGQAVASARGDLLGWSADSLTMAMKVTTTVRGDEQSWQRQPVTVPRSAVNRISERRLDRGRTALAIAASVAAAVALQQVAGGNEGRPPRRPSLPPIN